MTEVDQITFQRVVQAAHAQHRDAIRQATSAFDAACHAAQRRWQERLAKAKAAFEAVKSDPELGPEFDAIRREFDAARSCVPDIEPARAQLAVDVGRGGQSTQCDTGGSKADAINSVATRIAASVTAKIWLGTSLMALDWRYYENEKLSNLLPGSAFGHRHTGVRI